MTVVLGPSSGFPVSPLAIPGLAAHASSVVTRHISVEPSLFTVMSEYPALVRIATGVEPPCAR